MVSKRSILSSRYGLFLALTVALIGCAQQSIAEEADNAALQGAEKAAAASTAAEPTGDGDSGKKGQARARERVKKKDNFEQMERHKEDGYYASMQQRDQHKGDNYEQLERHKGEGYYAPVPATPKEYPKAPEPPKVEPAPEPVVVAPRPRQPGEVERRFDDDPGEQGSITYTRHMKSAREFMNSGHFEQAKKHFREAMHIKPQESELYPGLIESAQKSNDWSQVIAAIEAYTKLDASKSKQYEWQLGEAYFNLQKWDKAVVMLQKSLAHGHHQEQIRRYLLKISQLQKNTAESLNQYNALCKLKPNDYKTQLEYAALLEATGKPQEAIAHYKAATAANPADGPTFGRVAYLLMYHNKDYDGAIANYQRAISADPTNVQSYNTGIAYCTQQKERSAPSVRKRSN